MLGGVALNPDSAIPRCQFVRGGRILKEQSLDLDLNEARKSVRRIRTWTGSGFAGPLWSSMSGRPFADVAMFNEDNRSSVNLPLFHSPNCQVGKPQPVPYARAPRDCYRLCRRLLRFPEIDGLTGANEIVHRDVKRVVHHAIELAKRPRIRGTSDIFHRTGTRLKTNRSFTRPRSVKGRCSPPTECMEKYCCER
jgi:hypothetical protein